ncbi:hypothetical protein FA13DRAFT_1775428 [Coprinellus micaceus]|uniref:SH3 domain-containing protein n=1 Tax=Coprinellus micaceus TaxID=71717 RepID=A0A4Y7T5P0_COPMI|nr:hypothetical protein FA13DRAFT_1775428 [Coprinellus micaceus]
MVFTSLGPREKDAFFGLLDEYFASRPEIFAGGGGDQRSGTPQNAQQELASSVASSMKKAMVSNPEATAKVFSAGLRHASAASSPSPSGPPKRAAFSAGASPPPTSNAHADEEESEPGHTSIANRIAAFSGGRSSPASSTPSTTKKFGDVDLSSPKGFYNSLRHPGQQPASPAPPPAAPSFKANNAFSAPPTRRFGANTNTESDVPPPPAPPPPPPPPPMKAAAVQQEEEEERGDWADALYDYVSTEPGDLNIKEGQRILVTERSSDDWWTGEIDGNGKPGLFPASDDIASILQLSARNMICGRFPDDVGFLSSWAPCLG